MVRSKFDSNHAFISGGDVFALYSSEENFITVDDVTVNNCSDSSSFYLDTVSLKANKLKIRDNIGPAIKGGAIYLINPHFLSISNSKFSNLEA